MYFHVRDLVFYAVHIVFEVLACACNCVNFDYGDAWTSNSGGMHMES